MKFKLFILNMLVGFSALAQTSYSTNLTGVTRQSIVTQGTELTSVVLANSTATNIVVRLIDSKDTAAYVTNTSYTTHSYTVGPVTNIYTNFLGALNSNVFTGVTITTNTVAASTNALPVILEASVTANSTLNLTGNWFFGRGIQATNTQAPISITITHSP